LILLRDAEGVAVSDGGEWRKRKEPGWGGEGACDPGVFVWRGSEDGLGAGGEEGGGENGAAVEREAEEDLIVRGD